MMSLTKAIIAGARSHEGDAERQMRPEPRAFEAKRLDHFFHADELKRDIGHGR
jgi:hypothetical protein